MITITIYGQGYQSPGDGSDIQSTISIDDKEYERIMSRAIRMGKCIDEMDFGDLTKDLQRRMERKLKAEWGYHDGEEWNTFVSHFSINT